MATHHQFPARTVCPLCGCSSLKAVLDQRPDYEYGVSIGLPYSACQDPACGLVFATAMPPIQVVQEFYKKYSTHNRHRPSKIASLIAWFGSKTRESHLKLLFVGSDITRLNVLDYGCGSGDFMHQLTGLGVGGVVGYDFDPAACACAREQGLTAFCSESELRAEDFYDYVFLNHVVEHLSDPVSVLRALARSLKPGGRLVLRTPNSTSLLARLFGRYWRGWETPRHLHIFNARSIRQLIARVDLPGLRVGDISTSNAMFVGMFHESFHDTFWRVSALGKLLRHVGCAATLPIAYAINAFRKDVGEEVLVVIEKIGMV